MLDLTYLCNQPHWALESVLLGAQSISSPLPLPACPAALLNSPFSENVSVTPSRVVGGTSLRALLVYYSLQPVRQVFSLWGLVRAVGSHLLSSGWTRMELGSRLVVAMMTLCFPQHLLPDPVLTLIQASEQTRCIYLFDRNSYQTLLLVAHVCHASLLCQAESCVPVSSGHPHDSPRDCTLEETKAQGVFVMQHSACDCAVIQGALGLREWL